MTPPVALSLVRQALLGSPQASPSLGRFFARVSPQPSRPAEPPRPPQQALRVPLLPEGARKEQEAPKPQPPDMWSNAYIALYAHYACVGLVGGILTTALQPYCLYVKQAQPNTCATLATFINLPFGFKLFYGMISDCVPIFGQHRKPYIVGGWFFAFVAALVGAVHPDDLDLPTASSLFLAMTVAYLVADCAADAALVGYSTLEPKETRGSILSTAYSIRFTFNVVSAALVALLYNGPPSGGDFAWGLTLQQLLWLPVGFVGLAMGGTLPSLVEERSAGTSKPLSFLRRLVQVRKLMQQHAVWRLVLGLVLTTTLSLISNQAANNANARWFHMSPLQLGASNCLQSLCLAVGMAAYKKYLLHVSWRKTYTVGIVGMQLCNLAYLLTVFFPQFKNGWWVVFTSVNIQLAYAFTFVIGILIVPEITIPGFEGVVYGAVTSFTNQAQNLTNALNNLLLSVWPSNTSNEQLDLCALPSARRSNARAAAAAAAAAAADGDAAHPHPPHASELLARAATGAASTAAASVASTAASAASLLLPASGPWTTEAEEPTAWQQQQSVAGAWAELGGGAAAADAAAAGAGAGATTCGEVERNMASLTLLTVAIATCSLVFMPLLPRQKDETALMMKRPPSKLAGDCMLLLGVMLMVVGPAFACLSVFPQTSCLKIAGGPGC